MLPFLLYMVVFLGVPLYVVVHGALTANGHFTLSNFSAIFTQAQYLIPLKNSLILSLWTSLGPAILGLAIAVAVVAGPRDGVLRRVVSSASGVFAYFAGAPLAFVWIASLGDARRDHDLLQEHARLSTSASTSTSPRSWASASVTSTSRSR